MTRLTLVVPGLLWPTVQAFHPATDVPHAALSKLLGRGQRRMEPAISRERLLSRLLGAKGHSFPLAALRRAGEETGSVGVQDIGGAHWLCADPVNLSFMGGHVLLDEFNEDWDEISAAEVDALIAALNDEFAHLGHFSAASPTRWYLRVENPADARFFPLDEAVCRPVQDFLPMDGEGGENGSRHWQHVLNEIQVALHGHPVNAARQADGKRPINSLWFWGNDAQAVSDAPAMSRFAVQANEPLARGLARAAGIEPDAPDVDLALRGDTLVALDALAHPFRHLDFARWQDALAALERDWFAPIARAFDKGRLRQFALHVPGERASFSLVLNRGARWRFWRKPLPLRDICPSAT
ncbi:MAG: hypothetical protein LBU76_08300 [Azoarcus sp.]|jgi:hypothetical protein|nr:hypothetical protein [Azoarcus sp.]